MTDENTMPEEIFATEVSKSTVFMNGSSPVSAYDRQIIHPRSGPATKYIRADRHDEALRVIAECKTALKFYDNGYSYYAYMALQVIRDFEEGK